MAAFILDVSVEELYLYFPVLSEAMFLVLVTSLTGDILRCIKKHE